LHKLLAYLHNPGSFVVSWNWDHLRFFIALADAHTLVAAAEQLNVSHTTVLRRLKIFEAELEAQLFEHTAQGYRLTEQGESLYAEAINMKQAIDRVSRQIVGADRQAQGEVMITTTDTLAHEILPALLNDIAAEHAGLRFSLKMINQLTDIDNYEADIAIRTCRVPPDQLIGRKVGTLRFVACASVDYARLHSLNTFPDQTDEHRFIVLDENYRNSPFYVWLDERLTRSTYRTTVSNFLCAAALCRKGMGITVLPYYMLENQNILVPLPTDELISTNDLWILSHPDTRNLERVKLTRRLLHERLVTRFAGAPGPD